MAKPREPLPLGAAYLERRDEYILNNYGVPNYTKD